METADFNYNDFNDTNEADKSLLVKFYLKQVQDKTKTIEQGRPVFREKEYIDIRTAGTRSDAVVRPATPADKKRFPRHYEAFQKRIEMPEEGTPLSEWPLLSRSQVEELAYYNIKTVEQLAVVSDGNAQAFMGMQGLKAKAKEFLEYSNAHVEASQLKEELKRRDDLIEKMQEQLDTLMAAHAKTPEPEVESKVPEAVSEVVKAPVKRRRRAPKEE